MTIVRPFPYRVAGIHAQIGEVMPIDEWARLVRVPHRYHPERSVSGEEITRLIGVHGKSWDAERRFASLDALVEVARGALASADLRPGDVEHFVLSTSSPHRIMLDQDSFSLARRIGVPDDVVPLQMGAGCGGLGRAVAALSRTGLKNSLVICFNAVSPMMEPDGASPPLYIDNALHPFANTLWFTGALFSDACTAIVFRHDADSRGLCLYSRDSHSFGEEPGFRDSLVHYPGGGLENPPCRPGSEQMSAFGLNTQALAKYYAGGMMLNHRALEEAMPGYVQAVRRIYTHQAGPQMVENFAELARLPRGKVPTNVRQLGNLVSAATPVLFYTDYLHDEIGNGDLACFSVVGAGPERGAFIAPVHIPAPVARTRPQVPRPMDARDPVQPRARV
ncbi:3-oxoacyl-[acyl-carrier-protein] synthase III C-terminal domain-containing protein [Streptomyces sp. NPDC101776]|uniref:3-oxoacyl-[acyl-carrier-protein] synthase III C-terminal domain-containing protein n=1 Tax=Streptomyces sp. NPDC101776 TaxID=3366146 RepID=UPI0038123830